jgi:hypothetical protein
MKKWRGPFGSGEVRELKGTSPVANRLYGKIGDASGTEGMELDMLDEATSRSTATSSTETTETPKPTDGSAWALRLHDPSPGSTVMSITPRAVARARESLSPTPTPFIMDDHDDITIQDTGDLQEDDDHYNHDYNDYTEEWPTDQGWGNDAMMEWDAASTRDDDVSSVDREEAGLSDDAWGRDALLAWDDDVDDDDDNNDNDNDNDNNEDDNGFEIMHQLDQDSDAASDDEDTEETEDDLHARGMPTYRDWMIKDLQVRTYMHECDDD